MIDPVIATLDVEKGDPDHVVFTSPEFLVPVYMMSRKLWQERGMPHLVMRSRDRWWIPLEEREDRC